MQGAKESIEEGGLKAFERHQDSFKSFHLCFIYFCVTKTSLEILSTLHLPEAKVIKHRVFFPTEIMRWFLFILRRPSSWLVSTKFKTLIWKESPEKINNG